MSKYIATRAIRGANALVTEAEVMLNKALKEKGPDTLVSFPNTAYYLPTILGMTGIEVEKLGDLPPVLEQARQMLHPVPSESRWTPYLGETLDSGMSTLLAAEIIEAIRFVYGLQPEKMPDDFALAGGTTYDGANGHGHLNGPIDDIQLRSWGIQLVDGRMPGFAAIVGCAKNNETAVKIVRELQRRNILTFLSGNVNGRSIIDQLHEEGVELGYDTYTIPFGRDTLSAIYALGLCYPFSTDVRRYEARYVTRHPALQQRTRVRLRAGARRSRRLEICRRGWRHQLWLPGYRRHGHPRNSAHWCNHI